MQQQTQAGRPKLGDNDTKILGIKLDEQMKESLTAISQDLQMKSVSALARYIIVDWVEQYQNRTKRTR